ncbi:MAG TPA: TPM domain-containing protein, partial [Crenotrichaceae bacterium]|nr:TPM domain-containing protein [Crenotrichaceae bacterium]
MHDNDLSNNKVLLFTQVSNYSRWGVACLLLLLACVCHAAVDFPQLTGRVVDQANLLSEQQASRLTALLARHEEATSNQIVIVTLPSLQGLEIANYGYQLGRYWGVGQKDNNNGVLLIVAPKQRKVRIEVGYGLEGALTDILSHQIIQAEIIPYFRDGDFAGGIESGTKAILKAITGEYHAKPLPTHSSSRSYVPDWEGIKSLLYYIVIVGIVLWYLLNKNAITRATFHRIVLAIIPMYVVIWLLSASLFTASIVVWVFTLFYIAPWTAKMMSAMTLTMSTIANFAVFFCLRYFLDFQIATSMLTTLAIAI